MDNNPNKYVTILFLVVSNTIDVRNGEENDERDPHRGKKWDHGLLQIKEINIHLVHILIKLNLEKEIICSLCKTKRRDIVFCIEKYEGNNIIQDFVFYIFLFNAFLWINEKIKLEVGDIRSGHNNEKSHEFNWVGESFGKDENMEIIIDNTKRIHKWIENKKFDKYFVKTMNLYS